MTIFVWQLTACILLTSAGCQALQTSKLQVQIPKSLRKAEGYDHRDAMFGIPPYGGSIQQQVYYANSDLCDPHVDKKAGYPEREHNAPWKTPFILMVDRGGCTFVQKVRNAQRAGATGVLIADNVCICERVDCITPKEELCESQEPLMADDGSGSDISIPSFLVFKEDADEIKDALVKNTHVRVEMSFKVPAPDSRVEYELWTSPSDINSRPIEETFGVAALALKEHASFTPHMYVYDGERAGCVSDQGTDQCYNLCTNGGRYCSTDPDDDLDKGASGADVVKESLRRICIWNFYGEKDGIGEAWWAYIQDFLIRCATADPNLPDAPMLFNDEACVADSMSQAGINKATIDKCMAESGGADVNSNKTNALLEAEIKAQASSGVVLIPALLVNQAVIRGSLSFSTVFKAICSGYVAGSEPPICKECANCHDELLCVTRNYCPTTHVGEGGVPIEVFAGALVGLTILFCCVGYLIYQRQQRIMRDQIHGIVAEYMPVSSQSAKEGTSLALESYDEDDNNNANSNNNDALGSFTIS